jgi:GT2 family glycosyltransferase
LRAAPAAVAYAYTQMQLFGREETLFASRPFDPKLLLDHNFINCSALVRRSAFEAVGGWNPSFRVGYEDHELWVRMLARGHHGVFVPEPLLRYRRHHPSRNDLSDDQLDRLHVKLMLSQPRLYWRKILTHPVRVARGLLRPI